MSNAAGDPINIAFCGPKRSGKSHAMASVLQTRARSIVIDPAYTYDDGDAVFAGPRGSTDLYQAAMKRDPGAHWRYIWRPPRQTDMTVGLATLAACAREVPGLCTLAVDELAVIRMWTKDGMKRIEEAGRLGRHDQVSLLLAAQRVVDVPTSLWGGVVNELWLFGYAGLADRKRVRDNFGKEATEAVEKLPPYGFLCFRMVNRFSWSVEDPV